MNVFTTVLAGALIMGGMTMVGCSDDGDDGAGGTPPVDCNSAAGVTECKRRAAQQGSCPAVSDCACDNCTCQLDECEKLPTCVDLRMCVVAKACCPSTDPSCAGQKPACTDADQCGPEVEAAVAAGTLQVAVNLGLCTVENSCPSACP